MEKVLKNIKNYKEEITKWLKKNSSVRNHI